ncbi:hypothetical protein [Halogranum amylolyticum]|nr:hypothetical protein [Halogranum amylolyticum]
MLDFGRVLLFLVLLSLGLLGSLFVALMFYGMAITDAGTSSLLVAIDTGGRSATQILASFTEAETMFYSSSLYSALFAGAASYWVYQKLLANLGRLRW